MYYRNQLVNDLFERYNDAIKTAAMLDYCMVHIKGYFSKLKADLQPVIACSNGTINILIGDNKVEFNISDKFICFERGPEYINVFTTAEKPAQIHYADLIRTPDQICTDNKIDEAKMSNYLKAAFMD